MSKTKIKIFLIAIFILGLSSANACYAVQYQITDIGSTQEGFFSKGLEINNASQIVGKEADALNNVHAFFWDPIAGIRRLLEISGATRATGINNQSQICGISNDHAVMWNTPQAEPVDLGTFGGATSYAFKMGPNGKVVGWSDYPDYSGYNIYHAFLYENGTMTDLGTLANFGYYYNGWSLAYDVNSSGKVVGVANNNDWVYHAFVWDANNGMIDLGTDPNHPDYEGYAVVINESGDLIGGNSKDMNYNSYPIIWRNGSTVGELVPQHPIYPYAEFYDMNNSNDMVGIMWNDAQVEHAFVYTQQDGIQDLNDLIPLGSGWELDFAKGINDSGQITGYGRLNGEDHAYLLTPAQADTIPPDAPSGLTVR